MIKDHESVPFHHHIFLFLELLKLLQHKANQKNGTLKTVIFYYLFDLLIYIFHTPKNDLIFNFYEHSSVPLAVRIFIIFIPRLFSSCNSLNEFSNKRNQKDTIQFIPPPPPPVLLLFHFLLLLFFPLPVSCCSLEKKKRIFLHFIFTFYFPISLIYFALFILLFSLCLLSIQCLLKAMVFAKNHCFSLFSVCFVGFLLFFPSSVLLPLVTKYNII
jgi:hypothetical protein